MKKSKIGKNTFEYRCNGMFKGRLCNRKFFETVENEEEIKSNKKIEIICPKCKTKRVKEV